MRGLQLISIQSGMSLIILIQQLFDRMTLTDQLPLPGIVIT